LQNFIPGNYCGHSELIYRTYSTIKNLKTNLLCPSAEFGRGGEVAVFSPVAGTRPWNVYNLHSSGGRRKVFENSSLKIVPEARRPRFLFRLAEVAIRARKYQPLAAGAFNCRESLEDLQLFCRRNASVNQTIFSRM
jgi:hypothetical protein